MAIDIVSMLIILAVLVTVISRGANVSGGQSANRRYSTYGRTVTMYFMPFSRIFHLPPFAPPIIMPNSAMHFLNSIERMRFYEGDDLVAGPVALIMNPNLSLINRNNPTHTAGVTFFGQLTMTSTFINIPVAIQRRP